MGSIISKPKEKLQKKEGLIAQMKTKTEAESPSKKAPSPSRKSPSPPPRRLSSTLETASLTREFLTFLQDLDKASLLPQNESGRAQTLQFVLEVKQLKATEKETERVRMVEEIGRKYFSEAEDGRKLVLENSELWRRCSQQCAKCEDSAAALENLGRAHDSLLAELDENHLMFLQTRPVQANCVDKVMMCLL